MDANNVIFALDIGTRSIIGIVGVLENNKFKVLAADVNEHNSRSMIDGQVHDIEQVAATAIKVKKNLETKLNIKLKKVAIAAAGRVLKTKQLKIDMKIDMDKEIDRELVKSLEMEGIQLAQRQLHEELDEHEKTPYYCVGYDIINYYLNNYVMSSLVGHKGKSIGADILATFLPHTVVDSLYAVIERIGLEVVSLTLEPIAAINVAIPQDLRLLNLALVDIGAGTSDIALTKNGSVVAYAMVPVAGDEITEILCQHYLIDFNTAEKIKTSLSTSNNDITFTDIIGIKHVASIEEIKTIIRPAIINLASVICDKILKYNGKSPNAVFLIGGGSQINELTELIANHLHLPLERVAIRDKRALQNVRMTTKKLDGPDAITPIGIAVTSLLQQGQDFLSVTVNDKPIQLLNSRKLNISDALTLIGFNPGDLFGKLGNSLHFQLNGEQKTLKGKYGKSAEITLNDKPASLESPLKSGDSIHIKPAEKGEPAKLTLIELIEYYADTNYSITVNGNVVDNNYVIRQGDVIETIQSSPEEVEIDQFETEDFDYEDNMEDMTEEHVIVNKVPLPPVELEISVNDETVMLNGNKQQYIFVDIFDYIDFDLSKPKGAIVLKLNGRPAAFTDILKKGDQLEIYWDNQNME